MTQTHELGHVVGGWIGGATLIEVDLRPWQLPYSIHSPDPSPLITLWSGPLLGVVVPVAFAIVANRRAWWFVADFCLLANGTYLALAWFSGEAFLDASRLFQAGASKLMVATYCLLTIGVGYPRFRNDCIWMLGSASKPPTACEKLPDSADDAN
ncbi:hypothetical protein [Rhodopirellula sp. P2]|uniref:hypothetical protein n=1 Tax=Rhodopirellula sp. P2 TaxID=2127060 RepID=UPI002368D916|nr:hypothetical protein [Rhodopirellula sp. P2]WDQ19479.1 hypothetical protein PSR62_16575 [Rhodopirellula sp. P2]